MFFRIIPGIIVAPCLDGLQAAGLWRVPEQEECQDGYEDGDCCGKGEGPNEEIQFGM